ncbi:MAG: branched-chain amino acid ABC transporter permease [Chloroflexi bacterium]|nr:branched-chain amino acid ABC transporter permease [Chloroflexota bacterium]
MTAVTTSFSKMRGWVNQRPKITGIVLLAAAVIVPFVVKPYYISLTIEVLVFAIFAMSLDLLLGYTGLASFGQAAFFGLGAYIAAYITSTNELALGLTSNLLLTVPVVMGGTAVVALLIGFFALRTSGVYFLMITLAFAQMLFSIAIRWSGVTGGSDGLPGVARPTIGFGPLTYAFTSRTSYYFLVLLFFLISLWIMHRLINSPFGWTLRGIRENEPRMKSLGYNTFRYKMATFAIAGAFAGLAGMLLVHFFRHASPDNLYWTISGQVIVMVVIGGAGTLTGPILGAALVRLFPLLVSSYTERWETLEGMVFILFVIYAPKGIMGLLHGRRKDEEV